jgi:hypothetical protein
MPSEFKSQKILKKIDSMPSTLLNSGPLPKLKVLKQPLLMIDLTYWICFVNTRRGCLPGDLQYMDGFAWGQTPFYREIHMNPEAFFADPISSRRGLTPYAIYSG